jgi:CheY-like chemotaxis protein
MKNENLNILVVDDEPMHRRSAEILLKGHRLTIVSSYDEAKETLTSHTDYKKEQELQPGLLEKAGLSRDFNPYQGNKDASDADKGKYHDACKAAREAATTHPNFDVVLVDLMMAASRSAQGGEGMQYVGKQMPVGTFLILLALHAGVKNIGMVTDMNHHHHPASAALDPINRSVIKVGETKIFATNYAGSRTFDEKTGEVITYEYLQSAEGKAKYPADSNYQHKGTFSGKGWNSILKTLLEGKDEEGGF